MQIGEGPHGAEAQRGPVSSSIPPTKDGSSFQVLPPQSAAQTDSKEQTLLGYLDDFLQYSSFSQHHYYIYIYIFDVFIFF